MNGSSAVKKGINDMQMKYERKREEQQKVFSAASRALMPAPTESIQRRTLLTEQEIEMYRDELERLKKELEVVQQKKDEKLSIASHELRTPITVIHAHAQLLERRMAKHSNDSSDLSTLLTSVKVIDEQTRRLSALIDNLLDPHCIQARKTGLRCELWSFVGLCRQVVEEQRLLSGRLIQLEVPAKHVMLPLDYQRMSQVVTNVVSNALKYSPQHLPVRVRIDLSPTTVMLQVSDAGPGIAADQRTRIFDAYYRTPDAQASARPGLGLGLAICKEIVEQHDGRIWCDSNVGEGSTFVVELPLPGTCS